MRIFTFNLGCKVNGIPVVEMGYMVKPGDVVNLMRHFNSREKVYILLNKPKNFTTALDEGQEFVMFRISKGSTTAKLGCRNG
jgi:23S rRNA pseudouridine2605 synthase